jgi:predicted phosphodiesterase
VERRLGQHGLVILSDLHLGEERGLLSNPTLAGALSRELAGLQEARAWPELRVVLLGDVFDLWISDLGHAMRAARPFLTALARLGAKVDYVVGNHDHHVILLLEELAFAKSVQEGSLHPPRYTVELRFEGTFLDALAPTLDLKVLYPHLQVLADDGRRAFLTHGHYLDAYMYFGLPLYLPKLVGLLVRGRLSEKKFEQALTAQYELLYATSAIDDVRKLETRVYSAVEAFLQLSRGRMLWSPRDRRSMLRGLSLQGQVPYVRRFLVDRGETFPGLFVFGHTHRAGLTGFSVRGQQVVLANSGTWRGKLDGKAGTYLVLEDAEVELHKLGEGCQHRQPW